MKTLKSPQFKSNKLIKSYSEKFNKKRNRSIYRDSFTLENVKIEVANITTNSVKTLSRAIRIRFDKSNSQDLITFKNLATILETNSGSHSAIIEKSDFYIVEMHIISNTD